jgi:hypothetical protein
VWEFSEGDTRFVYIMISMPPNDLGSNCMLATIKVDVLLDVYNLFVVTS